MRHLVAALVVLMSVLCAPPAYAGLDSGIWAGYVATNETRPEFHFGSVTATWTVPEVTCLSPKGLYGAWVGLGGGTPVNDWLVQGGTATDCKSADRRPHYYAFFEAFRPAGGHNGPITIPHKVNVNDRIVASVFFDRREHWTVTVTNLTQVWTFTKNYTLTVKPTSAEAVLEAPGHLFPKFGNVSFQAVKIDGLPLSRSNPDKWRSYDIKDRVTEAEAGSIATTAGGDEGFPVFWRKE